MRKEKIAGIEVKVVDWLQTDHIIVMPDPPPAEVHAMMGEVVKKWDKMVEELLCPPVPPPPTCQPSPCDTCPRRLGILCCQPMS